MQIHPMHRTHFSIATGLVMEVIRCLFECSPIVFVILSSIGSSSWQAALDVSSMTTSSLLHLPTPFRVYTTLVYCFLPLACNLSAHLPGSPYLPPYSL